MTAKKSEEKSQLSDTKLPGTTSVPARFKVVNPKRKSFQSIVEEVKQESIPNSNVRIFKQAAKNVIQSNRDRESLERVNGSAGQNDE